MLALLLLLAFAAWRLVSPRTIQTAAMDLAIAVTLLLQFRLGDDLVDLPHDRKEHPERILCQVENPASFWRFVGTLELAGLALVLSQRPVSAWLAWFAAQALLGLWYSRPWRKHWRAIDYHIILLKYPALVFVIASRNDVEVFQGVLVLLGAYLILCVYEAVSDPQLRTMRVVRGIAVVELILLLVLLAAASG